MLIPWWFQPIRWALSVSGWLRRQRRSLRPIAPSQLVAAMAPRCG
jgi:hypothetical protein